MFKNKYLTQLQGVQARIKTCKESIKQLNPPEPDSFKIGNEIGNWLMAHTYGNTPDVSELFQMRFNGFDGPTFDYLHKLGEYFINIADYYKAKKDCEEELSQLLKTERHLKDKLGID